MLYKELTLRSDSTYVFSIEGDMYAIPIKQEGYWKLKRGIVQLSARYEYKSVKVYKIDSIKSGVVYFYFYDAQGNPINNFVGSIDVEGDNYLLNKMKENLYKVNFGKIPSSIVVKNSDDLYKEFDLKLKGQADNVYHISLFIRDELQKDKWRFKYRDEVLYQKKGLEYKKISLE